MVYPGVVPKLWNQTIQAHRQEVRDAILTTAAGLAADQGLLSLTMSQIAEQTGIGRATLYKYFPDVEAILLAWHQRQIAGHLEHLSALGHQAGDASSRLEAVLEAYALHSHESRRHFDPGLVAHLHRSGHVADAEHELLRVIRDLLADATREGAVRNDTAPGEMATYCLAALTAARALPSRIAVRRLVTLTLDGLRPPG